LGLERASRLRRLLKLLELVQAVFKLLDFLLLSLHEHFCLHLVSQVVVQELVLVVIQSLVLLNGVLLGFDFQGQDEKGLHYLLRV